MHNVNKCPHKYSNTNICLCVSVCVPYLVAIHCVAVFEGKCFAQGNADGVAHNGHSKGITYHF